MWMSRGVALISAGGLMAASIAACGGTAPSVSDLSDAAEVVPAVEERDAPGAAEAPTRPPAAAQAPVVERSPAPQVAPPAPARTDRAGVESVRAVELEQPAVWPAADVVFATPEEAAADFVRELLIVDGDPVLGEFQAEDSRSGEVAVLFAGEDGTLDPPIETGHVVVRQLGPDNGWFVIAAVSDGATITAPAALAEVAAGAVTVEGEARGFEGTVVVSAFPAGDDDTVLDQQLTRGGAAADLEAYSVTLDLSDAMPGEVVAIFVQGDTGLGSDPGTFAAIPVVIEDVIPPTR